MINYRDPFDWPQSWNDFSKVPPLVNLFAYDEIETSLEKLNNQDLLDVFDEWFSILQDVSAENSLDPVKEIVSPKLLDIPDEWFWIADDFSTGISWDPFEANDDIFDKIVLECGKRWISIVVLKERASKIKIIPLEVVENFSKKTEDVLITAPKPTKELEGV